MAKRTRTLAQRLWAKIEPDPESGCWLWTGAIDKRSGYGRIQIDRRTGYAHRASFETFVGPIPEGLEIDHLCRNRACVNPSHLEPVTSAENTRRSPITHGGETHCPRGHEYAGENLYLYEGRRHCRTCRIATCAKWHAARRESA